MPLIIGLLMLMTMIIYNVIKSPISLLMTRTVLQNSTPDGCQVHQLYRVTQNKVHHLLAILHLIFEANITQVSYVVQCIILNEVQFNEVQF